jgi:hypothetical protein
MLQHGSTKLEVAAVKDQLEQLEHKVILVKQVLTVILVQLEHKVILDQQEQQDMAPLVQLVLEFLQEVLLVKYWQR